jgi:hypothetical protein
MSAAGLPTRESQGRERPRTALGAAPCVGRDCFAPEREIGLTRWPGGRSFDFVGRRLESSR